MINSLSKDSHIGQFYNHKIDKQPQGAKKKALKGYAAKNDIGINTPAKVNFGGRFDAKKGAKFLKSKFFEKSLEFSVDQNLVTDAGIALLLTGIFRPGCIMTLPGKKNKDDKKYASAHSMASGVIGFAISSIAFAPFSRAVKEFVKEPANHMKNKASSILKDNKLKGITRLLFDRLPDIVGSVPKGILTVALIPPILKHVFGWEKKAKSSSNNTNEIKPPVDFSLLNFKSSKVKNEAFMAFQGGAN